MEKRKAKVANVSYCLGLDGNGVWYFFSRKELNRLIDVLIHSVKIFF